MPDNRNQPASKKPVALISRRGFLHASAAAVMFPAIVPASAFGADSPSNRVTLGMIGAGSRANQVLDGFLNLPDVRVLAVSDCFASRREATARRCNERYQSTNCKTYPDFREILARPDIDGVLICTPDHWHVPAAILAARAGKDMYVEKPLTISLPWAWQLRQDIRRNGCVFQYGTQQRSNGNFRFACELARNGYAGPVRRVEAWCADMGGLKGSTAPIAPPAGLDYDRWVGPAAMIPYTADRCTSNGGWHCYNFALGFIAGWGAHPLDIAQWGLDMDHSGPVHYQGCGEIAAAGIYDTVVRWDVHCRYANNIPMHFMSSPVAQPVVTGYRNWCDHGTTFFGDDGWVSVDRTGIFFSDNKLARVRLKPGEIHLYESAGQDRNFVDCIKSRALTINPVESAIRSDTISHLSDLSIRLGRAIHWDPQTETIPDDPQAAARLKRPMRAPWLV